MTSSGDTEAFQKWIPISNFWNIVLGFKIKAELNFFVRQASDEVTFVGI